MTTVGHSTASHQNILEVVRKMRSDLRKSDRKVADALLEDPRRILNSNVAETAAIAEVSQPTVIRFCTAIGCEGFQDFKLRLAQSLALGMPATHSALQPTDSVQDITAKIFDYTITSLDWARHHLDPKAMDRAVALLYEAKRIEFFGFGASAIVAQDAQQKFPLFGVPCIANFDSHQQLIGASMLGPGDVAVAISNTGWTRSILELSRLAREQGAKVIAITGDADAPIVNFCDVAIIAETLDNTNLYTPTISRLAALAVIDILSTSVALRRGEPQNERLVRMKRHLAQTRRKEAF